MRHQNRGRKLSRTAAHRKSMFANLAIALIEHERITTTDAKARELRRVTERLITLGKKGTLAARRNAFARLRSDVAVSRLFDEIAPRYKERPGGYTRVLKVGLRRGDAAPMAIIELVDRPAKVEAEEEAPAAE
jgi:large subunit ribosomal protein L17